ncbi:MAG TPA: FAD:protein FMN transferase [Candidatus Saccharibacteria bacterium]|nr:FAD:protein FMN transferase [Candidatus Saccharibacteria bacterium]
MKHTTFSQQARALGTNIEFRLNIDSEKTANVIFKKLWVQTENFQNRFSRFLRSSELTKLNQNHGHKTAISNNLVRILNKTAELSDLTEGVFNPFCIPLLQKAGYIKSLDSLNSNPAIDYTDRKVVDTKELKIGSNWALIPKNTAIDLGGIGKGYLADELSGYLDRVGIENYCLSIGGDLVAKGKSNNKKWSIDVPSATSSNMTAGCQSKLNKFAVATSGLARTVNGKRQPHLIDPRTQTLAKSPYITCSVISEDCVSADVIASCILICGTAFAKKMLELNKIKGVLLQGENQNNMLIMGTGFYSKVNQNSVTVEPINA